MTSGRNVKHSMVMYLWKDCDPERGRNVQYGDVVAQGL